MNLIYTIAIFCLASLWSLTSAHSQSSTNAMRSQSTGSRSFYFSTDFSLGAIGFKEQQDESQLIQFSARPNGAYELTEEFGVRGDAQLNLTTGRSQSRFQNPNFSLVNILELSAYYEPAQFFRLSAGALSQAHFNNRMLIGDRGFPGVMLKSGFANKKIKITPKVQYAIPTSTSFEDDRTEAEPLPTLTSVGIEADWQALKWLGLNANVNQFEFSDLPSVVAFQSSRLGNSVIGTDPSESQFRYQFAGLSQAYEIAVDYTPHLQQKFKIGIIDNAQAPSDRRRSQWLGTSVAMDFGDFAIIPEYAQFFAESDSVPALYSAFELGRSNREGASYGLEVNLKKLGVSIKSQFVDARLIEARPLQADMQIFNIALEFNDVTL